MERIFDSLDIPLAQSQLCVRSLLFASGFLLSFSFSPIEPGKTEADNVLGRKKAEKCLETPMRPLIQSRNSCFVSFSRFSQSAEVEIKKTNFYRQKVDGFFYLKTLNPAGLNEELTLSCFFVACRPGFPYSRIIVPTHLFLSGFFLFKLQSILFDQ